MTVHTYNLNNCHEKVCSITTQILRDCVATDIEGGGNCLLVHSECNGARIIKTCSTFAKVIVIIDSAGASVIGISVILNKTAFHFHI